MYDIQLRTVQLINASTIRLLYIRKTDIFL